MGFCFFQSLGLSLVSIYHWPIKCYSVSVTFISHGIIIYDSKLFPGNTTRSQSIIIYNNYDYDCDYDYDYDNYMEPSHDSQGYYTESIEILGTDGGENVF